MNCWPWPLRIRIVRASGPWFDVKHTLRCSCGFEWEKAEVHRWIWMWCPACDAEAGVRRMFRVYRASQRESKP